MIPILNIFYNFGPALALFANYKTIADETAQKKNKKKFINVS
jgi:hypothetical protein